MDFMSKARRAAIADEGKRMVTCQYCGRELLRIHASVHPDGFVHPTCYNKLVNAGNMQYIQDRGRSQDGR